MNPLLFLLLAAPLLYFADLSFLVEAFHTLPLWLLPFFLLAQLLLYILKAWRFHLLLPGLPFFLLLRVTVLHNFLLTLLPARLGEIGFLQAIRKHTGLAAALADLLHVRLADGIVLVWILVPLLADPALAAPPWMTGAAASAAILLVAIYLLAGNNALSKLANWLQKSDFPGKDGVARFLVRFGERDGPMRGKLLLSALPIWLLSLAMWIPLLAALAQVEALAALRAAAVAVSFSLLPVSPPGGIGLVEGGWAAGLAMAGIPVAQGIALGILAHAVQWLTVSILALGFYWRTK